jgi:Ca-activated chloride channel family protein
MKLFLSPKLLALFLTASLSVSAFVLLSFAQSKPQVPTDGPKGTQKKNTRPDPSSTPPELKKPEEKAEEDPDVLTIATNIVNVDAVVYRKKDGQIVTGLKKDNFAIFENGVKQDITNFSTPEAPITVSIVVEFSKWSEVFGYYGSRGQEGGMNEVIRPVAYFVSNFIKPPDDYASIVAFDMRPTPITDFTNDPNRLRQSVDLLLRNSPAFRENNIWDALNFTLMGGRGDTVVLENSKEKYSDYAGMVNLKAKRKAILLITSGIDTFSKINYDKIRKVIQNAGVPIYIIGTGKMFEKLYGDRLPATDALDGTPGRMTFIQADNAMKTIAKESGGAYYPVTFEGEVPSAIQSINALLRNQYSLGYEIGERPRDGRRYELDVKVDVNGDGQYDDKEYIVQHRPFYNAPDDNPGKKKKKEK